MKIPWQDKTIDAEIVPFTSIAEQWSEYMLDDGSVARVKLVATRILKLPEEFKNPDGTRQYFVQSQTIVIVNEHDK